MTNVLSNLKTEILNFIRNGDFVSIEERNVKTTTITIPSNVVDYVINDKIKNVRSVNDGTNELKFGKDYDVDLNTGVITFVNSPTTTEMEVTYDYGDSDRIFSNYPQTFNRLEDFPHVAFEITNASMEQMEIGAENQRTSVDFTITYYGLNKDDVDDKAFRIREAIRENTKNFHYAPVVTPLTLGGIIPAPIGETKLFYRTLELKGDFIIEGQNG